MPLTRTIHYCETRLQAYQMFRFKLGWPALKAWKESADFSKISRWFGDGHMHPPTIDKFRGGQTHEVGSYKVFWSENPGKYMRTVGAYSELCRRFGWRCDHTGWYLDREFQEDTTEGIVYQLPARKGQVQFMIGRTDPNNDGAALLEDDIYYDLASAAKECDSLARICAEEESEYQEAYREGSKAADLLNESVDDRKECRQLLKEINAIKTAHNGESIPTTCKVLRSKIKKLRHRCVRKIKEAKEIIDGVGHWQKDAFDCGLKDHLRKGIKIPQ